MKMIEFIFVVAIAILIVVGIYTNNKRVENCNNMGGQVVEIGLIKKACIYPK